MPERSLFLRSFYLFFFFTCVEWPKEDRDELQVHRAGHPLVLLSDHRIKLTSYIINGPAHKHKYAVITIFAYWGIV